MHIKLKGKEVQWLSGRVLDSRRRGCGFEPHRRCCFASLSICKTHLSLLILVQPRKTHPDITEKSVDWDVKN